MVGIRVRAALRIPTSGCGHKQSPARTHKALPACSARLYKGVIFVLRKNKQVYPDEYYMQWQPWSRECAKTLVRLVGVILTLIAYRFDRGQMVI